MSPRLTWLQVRVGDVLRATTAATMQMTYPTLNLLFGGKAGFRSWAIGLPLTGTALSVGGERGTR